MEKLIVLGTGNAMVTRCYNTCFVVEKDGKYLLVDGGGGNQILRILADNGIAFNDVSDIFLTHAHTDHVFGLIWVIRRIAEDMLKGKNSGKVNIYSHSHGINALKTMCGITLQKKMLALFGERIIFNTVSDGDTASILGNEMSFFDIRSTKLVHFGFAMTLYGGKRLVCLGDEPCCAECEPIAKDADWLLSEAFCRYGDRDKFKPYEKHHATVKDACELAERMGAKNLILWHSEEETLDQRQALYSAEGREYYHGGLYVPNDGNVIPLD